MARLLNKIPQTKAARLQSAGKEKAVAVSLLGAEHEAEVLAFLAERPTHTFGLAGFVRDNGMVSTHNRGKFYACRDESGRLEGVALIGHATLFETRSEAAIAAFARIAQQTSNGHLLLGEQEKVNRFWEHYCEKGQEVRLYCRELMFEQRWPVEVRQPVDCLRVATLADLDLVVPVHAETALEESGINPLEVDPEGFRQRCARRIEKGRTCVWVEGGKLIFKAEIVTDTPEVAYLEGVWVNPQERGKGYGLRCVSQMTRSLLRRTKSVCLLVNENNKGAQELYCKAGYKLVSHYETIFLK